METQGGIVVGDLERLAGGFEFTEGPVWDARTGELLFSDMPGDVRRRWRPDTGVVEVARGVNMANGMALDRDGRLIVCEHASSRVVRIDGPTLTVLASHLDGKALNSPNDVVVAGNGDIYFTDPTFGRSAYYGVEREPELSFRGVYRVAGDAGPELLRNDFDQPNGLCFSPDESVLYVNDTARAHIRRLTFDGAGAVSSDEVFVADIGPDADRPGAPDGMKCDQDGNVYVSGPGGIWVFSPAARKLAEIAVPEVVANFTWGGDDWRDLFVTASTSLYRVRLSVPGARTPGWLDDASGAAR